MPTPSPAAAAPTVRPPRAAAGLPGALLTAACLLVVALIGLLDSATDARLAISILYLVPAAVCAWCCGFSPGVLVSLAGAGAWHMVDLLENPALPPAYRAWNFALRLGVLALASRLASRLRVSIHRERLLARTDSLTGAANGRTYYEAAAAEAERARRNGRPLTLAYFDLDDFKALNDRLGHAAGDQALRCVVRTAQRRLRAADLLARLGGDEFALLLPETGAEGALALLDRLREELVHELGRGGWPVTVSVGAVTFPHPPADVDRMVQRVDALMYAAKRLGKARLEHAVVGESESWARPRVERRATVRTLCGLPARIRREGEGEDGDEATFAAVRDLSIAGVGLYLTRRLPEGAVLTVEPLASGARTLLARVVHTTPDGGGWRHGCELSSRLSPHELACWLGNQTVNAEVGSRNGEDG
jgi:diguanylate cyclase (GGDEF)-like protein